MKLDYPAFLGGIFRDLEWYGAYLRKEHGQGMRRNIRFDEEALSLYMDVLLPGNKEWLRVTPKMAGEERRESQEINEMSTRMQLRQPKNRLLQQGRGSGQETRTPQPQAAGKDRGTGQEEERMDFDHTFKGFPNQTYRSPRKKN